VNKDWYKIFQDDQLWKEKFHFIYSQTKIPKLHRMGLHLVLMVAKALAVKHHSMDKIHWIYLDGYCQVEASVFFGFEKDSLKATIVYLSAALEFIMASILVAINDIRRDRSIDVWGVEQLYQNKDFATIIYGMNCVYR